MEPPPSLGPDDLRKVIVSALSNDGGATFVYDKKLQEKLSGRSISMQDLLCVCRNWQDMEATEFDGYGCWRYRIEGYNLDGKWMAVILAVTTSPITVVAITGYRFSKRRRKKS